MQLLRGRPALSYFLVVAPPGEVAAAAAGAAGGGGDAAKLFLLNVRNCVVSDQLFLPDWLRVLGPGDRPLEPEQREVVDELGELVVGVLDQLGDADLEVLI